MAKPQFQSQAFEYIEMKSMFLRRSKQSRVRLSFLVVLQRHQAGIAARGGRVDGQRALGRKAVEVMRPADLRPGAREALAAERLHADDGADHVAIDVAIADRQPRMDRAYSLVDAAMDAKRQAEAG